MYIQVHKRQSNFSCNALQERTFEAGFLFEKCEHAVAEIKREIEIYTKDEAENDKEFFKDFLKVLEFFSTKNVKYTCRDLSKEISIRRKISKKTKSLNYRKPGYRKP